MTSIKNKRTSNACWEDESFWQDDSIIDSIACGKENILFTEKDEIPPALLEFFETIRDGMKSILSKLVYQNMYILTRTRNFQSIWDSVLESHMLHADIMKFVLKKKTSTTSKTSKTSKTSTIDRSTIVNLVEKHYHTTTTKTPPVPISPKKNKLLLRPIDFKKSMQERKICILESLEMDNCDHKKDEKEMDSTAYLIANNIQSVQMFVNFAQLNYKTLFYECIDFRLLFKNVITWNNFTIKDWTMFYFEQMSNPRFKGVGTNDILNVLTGMWIDGFYLSPRTTLTQKKTRMKCIGDEKSVISDEKSIEESLYDIMKQIKFLGDFCAELARSYPKSMVITKLTWMSIINTLENFERSYLYLEEKINAWLVSFFDIVKKYWKVNQKKLFQPFNLLSTCSLFYDQSETIQNIQNDFFDAAMDL